MLFHIQHLQTTMLSIEMRCCNYFTLVVLLLLLSSICCSPLPSSKSTLDSGKPEENSIAAQPCIVQNVRIYNVGQIVVSSRTGWGTTDLTDCFTDPEKSGCFALWYHSFVKCHSLADTSKHEQSHCPTTSAGRKRRSIVATLSSSVGNRAQRRQN